MDIPFNSDFFFLTKSNQLQISLLWSVNFSIYFSVTYKFVTEAMPTDPISCMKTPTHSELPALIMSHCLYCVFNTGLQLMLKNCSKFTIPNSQDIEVSSTEIQLLIFCSCQSKAKSEDRENQGEKPCQNKKNCPQRKSTKKITTSTAWIFHLQYKY